MILALIGSNGMLARKVRELAPPHYDIRGFDLPGFDLTDQDQVLREMSRLQPDVIVNCAAYNNVDGAESEEELARRVNGAGVGYLAAAAQAARAVLVHISTDYVFDGRKQTPYREEDPPSPLSAYGRSKLAGEEQILRSGLERYLILRTSWLYGPGGKNFVETILRLAKDREELRVVADQIGCPTYTGDLAEAIFRLVHAAAAAETQGRQPLYGLYHYSGSGECSWHVFAETIVACARATGEAIRAERVVPIATGDYPQAASRPAYSVFSKEKYLAATGAAIPEWPESLAAYLRERVE